ncbi:Mitochondrial fission process protein 1 [Eumeta japonica]|uniref:Mitochondrial fission process protein 1 n=1 Tax=Eumeta variegata TaxID=151549 RepID=A0A4C1XL93_EUMVA|nr:Mitochondrial fission process protein 1 [Eumeta japonica]
MVAGQDFFRDTWIRYMGYANEVGEAFRGVVPAHVVRKSYYVAFGYVVADTAHKSLKVLKNDRKLSKSVAVAGDALIWQTLASVLIPGLAINRICAYTGYYLKRNPKIPIPAKFHRVVVVAIGFRILKRILTGLLRCPSDHLSVCRDLFLRILWSWSLLSMNTRDPRGVTNALPASWVSVVYLMEGEWVDGGRVSHWNSHSLDEVQQWEREIGEQRSGGHGTFSGHILTVANGERGGEEGRVGERNTCAVHHSQPNQSGKVSCGVLYYVFQPENFQIAPTDMRNKRTEYCKETGEMLRRRRATLIFRERKASRQSFTETEAEYSAIAESISSFDVKRRPRIFLKLKKQPKVAPCGIRGGGSMAKSVAFEPEDCARERRAAQAPAPRQAACPARDELEYCTALGLCDVLFKKIYLVRYLQTTLDVGSDIKIAEGGDVTTLADTSGDTEGEAEAEAEAEAVDVSIRTPLVASTPPARRSPHHRRQDTDGGGAGSEAVASLFPSAVLEESFAERLVFSVLQSAVSSLARCFQQIEDGEMEYLMLLQILSYEGKKVISQKVRQFSSSRELGKGRHKINRTRRSAPCKARQTMTHVRRRPNKAISINGQSPLVNGRWSGPSGYTYLVATLRLIRS